MAIAAVVVCNNLESKLGETLAALQRQKKPVDHVVVVLGPKAQDFDRKALSDQKVIWVQTSKTNFEQQLLSGVQQLDPNFKTAEHNFIWALTSHMVPANDALAHLVSKAEATSTAAMFAPKIMDADNPDLIREYGLTLTPRASLFSPVNFELDQAQHDSLEDALGARIAGSLFDADDFVKVASHGYRFTDKAQDLILGVQFRLTGKRVVLVPEAKVIDAAAIKPESRFADMQLKLFFFKLPAAWLLALALPAIVIFEALWLMFKKQPERVASELAAGFKAFFTAPALLISRRALQVKERRALKSLRSLYASKQQVKHQRADRREQSQQVELETGPLAKVPHFIASGAVWVMVGLLAVSWQFFPLDQDVAGPGVLPLGNNWFELFAATGSSWQAVGTGLVAPADPFNWVLLAIGSLTFWSPGLALALLFFFAKSLAFAASWRALTLVTQKFWILTAVALGYAFWPMFTAAQAEGRLSAVIAHLLIPTFIYSLARTFAIPQASNRQVTWAFTALAALTSAALTACAPSLAPILVLAFIAFAIVNFRKIGYLVWLPVPMAVIWFPTVWYRVVGLLQPVSLLADPGLPVRSVLQSPLELLLAFNWLASWQILAGAAVGILLLLAFFAPLNARSKTAVALWVAVLTAVAAAWLFERIDFVGNPVTGKDTGEIWVNGSPHALLSVAAMAVLLLVALTIDSVRWARAAGILVFPAVSLLGLAALLFPSQLTYSDSRVAPAIIRAEAQQGSPLKLLELRPEKAADGLTRFSATLVSGGGIHEANLNTSYRFALAGEQKNTAANYSQIAALAADLVSNSGKDLAASFESSKIGYVLVPNIELPANRDLSSTLDSIAELDAIGVTEFGQLWRVNTTATAAAETKAEADYWSLTKAIQFATIILFVLLALPSGRRVSRNTDPDQDDYEVTDGEEQQ